MAGRAPPSWPRRRARSKRRRASGTENRCRESEKLFFSPFCPSAPQACHLGLSRRPLGSKKSLSLVAKPRVSVLRSHVALGCYVGPAWSLWRDGELVLTPFPCASSHFYRPHVQSIQVDFPCARCTSTYKGPSGELKEARFLGSGASSSALP